MELEELVMESSVLSPEKKIALLDSIKKWTIDKQKLDEIIGFLIKNKNRIGSVTDKYVEEIKSEYNNYLKRRIPELKRDLSMTKIKIEEVILNDSEWEADELLNLI